MAKRTKSSVLRQERRSKVADLWKRKYSVSEIAKIVGIGIDTVRNDIRKMEQQWIKNQAINVNDIRMRELADLDEMEKLCIDRLESLKDSPTKGARWLEERRKIKVRRAELLGLDAATKFKVTTPGSEISKEQHDAVVKAALAKSTINKRRGNVVDFKSKKSEQDINDNSFLSTVLSDN